MPGIGPEREYFLALLKIGGLDDHAQRTATNLLFQYCEIESLPIARKDNHHFIILLPLADNNSGQAQQAEARLGRLIGQLEDELQLPPWHAGMSQPTDMLHLHKAYEQADFALRHSIQTNQPRQIKKQDETGLYKLFSHPAMAKEIDEYVEDWLGPVIAYDKRNNARLLQTLRIYLEHNGNYRQTARQLHVHHNTIRYRLKRLEQLTRRNLAEPQLRLQFQLALMMHDSRTGG